jgi:hypothetical protein
MKTAAAANRNYVLGEESQLSTSRPKYPKRERQPRQWPTEEELFQRWWTLDPGPARDKEFWRPQKLADHTEYSPSRIRGLCDEGELPILKVRGRLFIHIPSLLKAAYFIRPTT